MKTEDKIKAFKDRAESLGMTITEHQDEVCGRPYTLLVAKSECRDGWGVSILCSIRFKGSTAKRQSVSISATLWNVTKPSKYGVSAKEGWNRAETVKLCKS